MRCYYDCVSFSSTMQLNLFSPSKMHLWSLHWLWRVHDSNAFIAKFWPHFHGILTAFAITWGSSSVVAFTFKFSTLNPRNQTWVGWSLCGKDLYMIDIFSEWSVTFIWTHNININNGQLNSEKKFKAQQDILVVARTLYTFLVVGSSSR